MPSAGKPGCQLGRRLNDLGERIFLDPAPALIVSQNILLHRCHASVCLARAARSGGIYERGFLAHIFHLFEMLGAAVGSWNKSCLLKIQSYGSLVGDRRGRAVVHLLGCDAESSAEIWAATGADAASAEVKPPSPCPLWCNLGITALEKAPKVIPKVVSGKPGPQGWVGAPGSCAVRQPRALAPLWC